ncbi:hypothetical protein RchiOBHm_Chr7g0229131 [Rosa chinensis]|uniref:Uncharacterized protein n=1 Tax=Rosa chinensis TaxID=74649 RepID=A0A2P6PF16_ROSCH|nr:hypothetical protein RchiOBHm_Chr7g0229131 [Rosa chinensis]
MVHTYVSLLHCPRQFCHVVHEEDDDQGEVYIDEADILNKVDFDEEGAQFSQSCVGGCRSS